MVNLTRWKGHSPQSIKFAPTKESDRKDAPTGPEKKVAEEIEQEGKAQVKQYAKMLLACLERRPMWTRTSLLNQLSPDDKRIVSKSVWPVRRCRALADDLSDYTAKSRSSPTSPTPSRTALSATSSFVSVTTLAQTLKLACSSHPHANCYRSY